SDSLVTETRYAKLFANVTDQRISDLVEQTLRKIASDATKHLLERLQWITACEQIGETTFDFIVGVFKQRLHIRSLVFRFLLDIDDSFFETAQAVLVAGERLRRTVTKFFVILGERNFAFSQKVVQIDDGIAILLRRRNDRIIGRLGLINVLFVRDEVEVRLNLLLIGFLRTR